MEKPWSCGTIFAGFVLLIIFLALFDVIDFGQSDTTNTIVATKRACEAQTGGPC